MTAVYAVRMNMAVSDSEVIADLLPRCPQEVQGAVRDQLWLRTVLIEQFRRTNLGERDAFIARADGILAQLDPQETPAFDEEGER